MEEIERRKQSARAWFESLRDRICAALEAIETESAFALDDPEGARAPARFQRKAWQREDGGGGVMGLLSEGRVFEKAGANVSTVFGTFSEAFAREIPGAAENPGFWASGISLVIHPRNPLVPPVHMNTRYVVTAKAWFGGGADLNPIYPQEEDTAAFHARLRRACDAHGADYYERFSAWCDKYFFNKHRSEPRGVGGIFYDYLDADWGPDFAFTRDVGLAFLDIYPQLVRRNKDRVYGEAERTHQLFRRGRYAEFNLVYDRGTRFGLMTGGNPDAVLMSLPPLASWPAPI
ncbi:MAG: oxygen-dependent coproporphyrinogen oxidase [Rhodospirillales bacterium]|nr:oxygen-dependent coproporphyrinogen oxidase [Rhodospirillales bacterium]